MSYFEENGHENDAPPESGGVLGLVATSTEYDYYRELTRLQDKLHNPENWCPKDAERLLSLLKIREKQLGRDLDEHPEEMDNSGRKIRSPLGAHIAYDLELVRREQAMLALAIQHGHQHPETERAREEVRRYILHWVSGRGR